jgi:hypothetical protein
LKRVSYEKIEQKVKNEWFSKTIFTNS